METPASLPARRGPVRCGLALLGTLLSLGFAFRLAQSAFRWLGHAPAADGENYKALTLWALVYLVVTAGLALAAWRWDFPKKPT